MSRDDDQLALFQGFRPVGTKFSLTGGITAAADQPPREFTWSEEVTLIVRGYVKHVGYTGTPDDPGPTLGAQVVITRAYEVDEHDAERLIEDGAKQTQAVLDRRFEAEASTLAEAG